jgi:hypothetical protein
MGKFQGVPYRCKFKYFLGRVMFGLIQIDFQQVQ